MRAWDVLYLVGESTAEGMRDCGVRSDAVQLWHKQWGKRVLDPCRGEGDSAEVAAQMISGMTVARILVDMFGHD